MRILLLTFYFQPDLCAGSFRATPLARELSKQMSPNDTIHVVTTMPNRYQSYRATAALVENIGNIKIERIRLPAHKSGMIDQARAFAVYALGVWRRTRRQHYDVVFATSSRLMTAVTGALTARHTGARLYLDLRDIFTDTLSDMFAGKMGTCFLPLLRYMEKKTVHAASRVNLVSHGFVDYFTAIRDDLQYRTFTNGIDEVFLNTDYAHSPTKSGSKVILYAGNIGNGQGLDRIIPKAARALEPDWEFWIVGDGGYRNLLQRRIIASGVKNVRLIDPVTQSDLIDYYRKADVLFLHLNDFKAFEKVLPSKIFEYAATGKPLLAGVAGFSRHFIQANVPNSAVFDPCDDKGLVEGLQQLKLIVEPPEVFIDQFRRSKIIQLLVDDLMALAMSDGGYRNLSTPHPN